MNITHGLHSGYFELKSLLGNRMFVILLSSSNIVQGADKSLARPSSRCPRMDSKVSLEANLLLRSNNVCLLQTLKNL